MNLAKIEEAYQSVMLGHEEPDTLRTNPATAEQLTAAIMRVDPHWKLYWPRKFNAAVIEADSDIPVGEIRLLNHHYEGNPKYNCTVKGL